jgi:hypothetical protein
MKRERDEKQWDPTVALDLIERLDKSLSEIILMNLGMNELLSKCLDDMRATMTNDKMTKEMAILLDTTLGVMKYQTEVLDKLSPEMKAISKIRMSL